MNISEYNTRLDELQQRYRRDMAAANQYQDEDLTLEGLEKERKARAARARAMILPHFERLRKEFDSDVRVLNAAADGAIPKSDGSTRDAWSRVELLLNAGKTMPEVIAGADVATLQAIEEWAPAWLQAKEHKAPELARHGKDVLENNLRDRWVEVLPNATHAANLKEALEAKPDIARFEYTAGNFRTQLEGHNNGVSTLAAAFGESGAAEQAARRVPVSLATPTR